MDFVKNECPPTDYFRKEKGQTTKSLFMNILKEHRKIKKDENRP